MSLINASATMGLLETYKVVHIDGRYGGGKTLLAFRLAYDLVKRGVARRIVSNVRSVWSDNPFHLDIPDPYKTDTVIILDEGGLFLETGRDAKAFLAFLRKLNIYLIIPSVEPPSRSLGKVTIMRMYTLEPMGIPLYVYKTMLRTRGINDHHHFLYWRPSEMHGVYDTLGAPKSDKGIGRWMQTLQDRISDEEDYDTPLRLEPGGGGSQIITQVPGFAAPVPQEHNFALLNAAAMEMEAARIHDDIADQRDLREGMSRKARHK